ncbi:MAG: hypothetical protein H3C43_12920 [Leptonema sp. (in: Bacteria)]|nr:hypothetical protein [Leptonema sp. (in: bacteria)]
MVLSILPLQLYYQWPTYSKFWFFMSILLLFGLAALAYFYNYRKGEKERIWLQFVNRSLQLGMTYPEIEQVKPLYTELTRIGKSKTILQAALLRPYLLKYFAIKSKGQSDVRKDVHIFRRLAFSKHTEELLERKELDLGEPVSLESQKDNSAVFGQIIKVLPDVIELHVRAKLPDQFIAGFSVQMYLYRPESGGYLLAGQIVSIVDKTITVKTNFQFVHSDERHFMADLSMRAELCINVVPLIRLKELAPLTAAPKDEEKLANKAEIKWRKLNPNLGQFEAQTIRISDRGVVLYVDETKHVRVDKNFLNLAFLLTFDFIDGQPLEVTGHLLSMGRRGYYLFRFGELSTESRSRINQAVKANNPQKERLV